MAKTTTKTETVIEMVPMLLTRALITIEGDEPGLLVHAWSAKAKKAMLDKQMGKAVGKKAPKDPDQDLDDAFYRLPAPVNGMEFGFPVTGIKSSIVDGSGRFGEMKMTVMRGAFFVNAGVHQLVPIDQCGQDYIPTEMPVKISMTMDIRHRPLFPAPWRMELDVTLNERVLTLEQLVNCVNYGGFGVGIGEWRPEKNGDYGRFHVIDVKTRQR